MSATRTVCAGLLVFAVLAPSCAARPRHSQSFRQRRVHIYLPKEGGSSQKNPFNLQPVARIVSSAAPAQPTLRALLAGPTAAERAQRFMRLDTVGLRVGRLLLNRQRSRVSVDFVSAGPKTWAGDLSPATFKMAVQWTLQRLLSVRNVRVSVNGRTDFDSLR